MKYTCHLNRCEWANGKSGNCIWPGTYCPRWKERLRTKQRLAVAEAVKNVEVDNDAE